jgi:hypothetical protein
MIYAQGEQKIKEAKKRRTHENTWKSKGEHSADALVSSKANCASGLRIPNSVCAVQ